MPPKQKLKGKLHQLAVELPMKSIITDTTNKKQYCIGRQFASGGFGRIYTCNEVGSKREFAMKVEPYGNGPLFTEVNVFVRIFKQEQIDEFLRKRKLKRLGVPPLISCGIHQHGEEKLRFLVIPKYSVSLEDIREKSLKFHSFDVWTIARCMVESLEYIHSKNYTHADIKAANILLEQSNDFTSCVLVDYGLARMSSSNEDKPDKKRAHNGTALFTSCDAHRGCLPSYRGDLEILAYNIVYWLSGSLPWMPHESNPAKIYELKEIFLANLSSSLKKQLNENSDCVDPLRAIFKIVQETDYCSQLDFSALYKIIDGTLKKLRSGGRKRGSDEVLCEVMQANEKKEAKRNKLDENESALNGGNHVNTEDSTLRKTEKKEKLKEKVAKPHVCFKRREVHPSCSTQSNANEPSPRSHKEISRTNSSFEQSPSSHTSRKSGALQCTTRSSMPTKKSTKKVFKGVVPGLSVRRAPCSTINSRPTTSSREPVEEVSSDIKRSPNKLRKIPGMLNFKRGRRSIIIEQITKKYQRIAQNKGREKS
ncbi:hypothetical protein DICVIV_02500 [Dictyocaulus viviparus]|uniref:non-specific serine/threonine protein kinase n=1 Tax=Dictyocaulus viviparus TaxID=29172 RepID=A0A0D8Y539_DICVI|nr:hypothetical protein DICVIV_02500 [Dictyocaulus viviparus]